MAFQPIVDVSRRTVYAYEALVRGSQGEPAAEVFRRIPAEALGPLDQSCRITAIREAARLGLDSRLHLNFLPNSLSDPESCIRAIIAAAEDVGLPPSRITFEIVEGEKAVDVAKTKAVFTYFRELISASWDFSPLRTILAKVLPA